jgi:spoIIIJ-associated protein
MNHSEQIKTLAESLLAKMLETYEVEVSEMEDIYNIVIKTDDEASTIIGRHGETIRAFQKIMEVMLFKEVKEPVKLLVDVNDYRAKQKERLEYIGKQHADKVVDTSAPAYLRGFSSYERKIIHEIINKYEELDTYSEGKDPKRYIVIRKKKVG